jgi:predicted dehydrogenase
MVMARLAEPSLTGQRAVVPAARVALIGAGGFGRFILEAYRQARDVSVLAVADPNFAGEMPPTHPDLRIMADWRTILDDPAVEVIHLATPPSLRGEIAIPALLAGKSVFCEKPLALSLEEADRMIATAREAGTVVGIDYVFRHHPAFTLLVRLASSGLFRRLRTLSLQNFAQALPDNHWMWDEAMSGGILVEHGVHFFDAYAQVAGRPERIWGTRPRKEAVQVSVQYADGALGNYYHEFGFPEAVERTSSIAFFERGYVEIDGWIPERLHGRVIAPAEELAPVFSSLQLPFDIRQENEISRFKVRFADRGQAYKWAIVDGMRDLIARHRDPKHVMSVSAEDARESLAPALAARRATENGIAVQLSG